MSNKGEKFGSGSGLGTDGKGKDLRKKCTALTIVRQY